MKLFFETAGQASCFLASVPLGFALAFCLERGRGKGVFGVVLDIAAFLLFGLLLLGMTLFLSEEKLRLYHLLGAVLGGLLYMSGLGVMIRRLQSFFEKERQKHRNKAGV